MPLHWMQCQRWLELRNDDDSDEDDEKKSEGNMNERVMRDRWTCIISNLIQKILTQFK